MKYVRKPKEVEAMLYDGSNAIAIMRWSNKMVKPFKSRMEMETKYGTGYAEPGTWIIRGACGLFYPCSDKEFKDNYWKLAE